MSMQYTIVRPGGNDTCIISGSIEGTIARKRANDAIMRAYPNVEQVGFLSQTVDGPQLMMAGGEFCGNATRSAAALLLELRSGNSLSLRVSGVKEKLTAGITSKGYAFAMMPVYPGTDRITTVGENRYIVEMEGITHYLIFDANDTSELDDETIKRQSYDILQRNGLTSSPASGVMYLSRTERGWKIDPVVYVRDIDTLFRETACGSGTTALGLVLAMKAEVSISDIPVVQPSGMSILVSVEYQEGRFTGAVITGPLAIIRTGVLEMNDRFSYVCERVRLTEDVNTLLKQGGLSQLYRDIFSKAPYFESFSDKEIRESFDEYATQGLLYIARTDTKVIGFGAALPLRTQPQIATILKERGLDPLTDWYMANLGVDERYRRNGVARTLVRLRMDNIPKGSTAIMRTSLYNKASQSLYRDLGFTVVEDAYQNVLQQRVDGSEVEDTRLFLAKQMR